MHKKKNERRKISLLKTTTILETHIDKHLSQGALITFLGGERRKNKILRSDWHAGVPSISISSSIIMIIMHNLKH